MRKMRGAGNGSGVSNPHSQGPGAVGAFDCPVALEPPPGVPIRTAWVAGRLGIGFDDQGPLGIRPTEPALDPGCNPGGPAELHLVLLRDLDVDERPYLWDLEV